VKAPPPGFFDSRTEVSAAAAAAATAAAPASTAARPPLLPAVSPMTPARSVAAAPAAHDVALSASAASFPRPHDGWTPADPEHHCSCHATVHKMVCAGRGPVHCRSRASQSHALPVSRLLHAPDW
jgi:hypothetical protein